MVKVDLNHVGGDTLLERLELPHLPGLENKRATLDDVENKHCARPASLVEEELIP